MRRFMEILPSQTRSFSGRYSELGGHVFKCLQCGRLHSWYSAVTILLASVVQSLDPGHFYSSMSLVLNVQSARHRDANNYHGSVNMVVPLSAFDDGLIWCENRNGSYPFDGVQGDLIRVEPSFVKFNPKALHCAMLPTGTRFLLIAFHIRSLNLLHTEDRVLWSQ